MHEAEKYVKAYVSVNPFQCPAAWWLCSHLQRLKSQSVEAISFPYLFKCLTWSLPSHLYTLSCIQFLCILYCSHGIHHLNTMSYSTYCRLIHQCLLMTLPLQISIKSESVMNFDVFNACVTTIPTKMSHLSHTVTLMWQYGHACNLTMHELTWGPASCAMR